MSTALDFLQAQLTRRVAVPTEQGRLRLDNPWLFRYSYIGAVSGTFDIPTGYSTSDAHLIRVTDRASLAYSGTFALSTRPMVGAAVVVAIHRITEIATGIIDGDYVQGLATLVGGTFSFTFSAFTPPPGYSLTRVFVLADQNAVGGTGPDGVVVDGSGRLPSSVKRFYTYIDGASSDMERLFFPGLEVACFNAVDAAYGQGNAVAWADGTFDTSDPLNETGPFIMRRGLKICKLVERPTQGAALAFGSNEFAAEGHFFGTFNIPGGTTLPITIKAYIDLGTPTFQGNATIYDNGWTFDFDPNILGKRIIRMVDPIGTIVSQITYGDIPYTLVAEQPKLIRSYRITDSDPLLTIAPHLQDSCWPYDHAVATCALIPSLGDTEELRDAIRALLYNFFEAAKTTLTSGVSAAATSIQVASNHGFIAGDRLLIGYGTANEEVVNIVSVVGTAIGTTALTTAHLSGDSVIGVWDTPHTNLTAQSNAGSNQITVASPTGFAATDTVIIGRGATKEVWKINGIAGSVLTLSGNLVYTHGIGQQAVSGERTPAVQGYDFNIPFSFRSHYDFTHNWVFRQGGGACWVGYAITRYMAKYPASPLYSDCLTVLSRLMEHLLAEQNRSTGIQADSIRGGYGSYQDLQPTNTSKPVYDFFVEQNIVSWAATEHNVDFYFLCSLAYRVTGNTIYRDAATRVANHLVNSHWDPARQVLRQSIFDPSNGTDPDTVLDSISWGGMALSAMGRGDLAAASAGYAWFFRMDEPGLIAKGYRPYGPGYSGIPDPVHTVWGEGSFGLALYYYKLKDYANSCRVLAELNPLRQTNGSFLYVTDRDEVLELPPFDAVSSTAWELIASEYPEAVWTKQEGVKIVGSDIWTGLPEERFPVEYYCSYGFPTYQPEVETMGKIVLTVDVEEQEGIGNWVLVGTLSRLISGNFSFVSNGRFGEARLEVQKKFNEAGFLALATNTYKRLVFRLNGVAVSYAHMRRNTQSFAETQTLNLEAIGPVDETNRAVVRKKYQPPGGSADLSWFYFQLYNDYLRPRGFAQNVSIEALGITKSSITFNGTLREALTDLGTLAEGFVYWGFQIENDGKITFFVRRRDDEAVATYAETVGVVTYNRVTDTYSPSVTNLSHIEDEIDKVNKLFITGGETRFPNLIAVNPSFEEVSQGANTSNNLLKNGDFDGSNAGAWTTFGGGSIKTETEDPSHTGTKHLELDALAEGAKQGTVAVLPMKTYALDFYMSCENPLATPHQVAARIRWYQYSGGPLISTDEVAFLTDGKPWIQRTLKRQSPALTGYAEVEFQAYVLPGGAGAEKGVLVDTVNFYSADEVYQKGWRIETTATPKGQDANADPTGLYWVDWAFEYLNPWDAPSDQYGAYGIVINTYGLVGGKYVRLIQSSDGEFDVQEKSYYTLSIAARATDAVGAAPPAGNNFKMGVVWYKDDPNSTNVVYGPTVHLDDTWKIVGGQIFLPANAKRCRVFFEALDDLQYFLDGAQFSQSPSLPTGFSESGTFFDVVTVQDVYAPTDPQYITLNSPDDPINPGYGAIEEMVENPSVLTRADALIYAKSIFDARTLLRASEVVQILQIDAPITLYGPDGYMQLSGIPDVTLPKLWPARVNYEWTQAGLMAEIELEKEIPRLEQVLERERAISISSVGAGVDPTDAYVPPEYDTFTIVTSDARVTAGGSSNSVFTVNLDFEPIPGSIEVAVRGLEISPNWVVIQDDGAGLLRKMVLTLYSGMTLETDDTVTVWYRQRTGTEYASKTFYTTAAGPGAQTIVMSPTPLLNSVRPKVRGLRLLPSEFDVLLDPTTGEANQLFVHSSVGVETGDEITVKSDPDFNNVVSVYTEESLVPLTTPHPLPLAPIQFPDTRWGFELIIADQVFYNPTITLVSGIYYVDVPTDRAGDRMFLRIYPNFS